jgi:hypothetical protein
MHTFNSPPGWPEPPTPNWQPPPGWQPDPAWPPAPPGWSFWLNSRGLRARGPNGRYGAEPPTKLIAGWAAGGIAFIVILAAIGGSDSSASTAAAPVPGPTVTATATATETVTVQQTVPGPTTTITQPPLPARTVTVPAPRATTSSTKPARTTQPTRPTAPQTSSVYYANCSAARAAGVTPLYRGEPGYARHLDGDSDGVACE